MTEVYLLFLQSFLTTLTGPNRLLQSDRALIHQQHELSLQTVNSILRRFTTANINSPVNIDELHQLPGKPKQNYFSYFVT